MKTEPADFLRVVAMSADAARAFIGRYADQEPLDLGPADADRYKPGARVWGFRPAPRVAAFGPRVGRS